MSTFTNMQRQLLDLTGPLSSLHSACVAAIEQNCPLYPHEVLDLATSSSTLLGNVNSQMWFERQKLILNSLHPKLRSYAYRRPEISDSVELFGRSLREEIKKTTELNREINSFTKSISDAKTTGTYVQFVSVLNFNRILNLPFKNRVGQRTNFAYRGFRSMNSRYRGNNRRDIRSTRDGKVKKVRYDSRWPNRKPESGMLNTTIISSSTSKGGNLKLFLNEWKLLTTDRWIIETVQGYKIPFLEEPKSFLSLPNKIPFKREKEANSIVAKLIQQDVIQLVSNDEQFVHQFFFVPKSDGSLLPIINLKPLNKFVAAPHFKMEQLSMIKNMLGKNMFMAKVDLKDAYFAVSIAEEDRKYLKFQWNENIYQFKTLPFGLASAPFCFTKLTKPIVSALRMEGILLIIYIDDMFIIAKDESTLLADVKKVTDMFNSLGFMINFEKSILLPSQRIEFLGFMIDSTTMTISIPIKKLNAVKDEAINLYKAEKISPRELAKFIGILNA